jgi:hypothetical protein
MSQLTATQINQIEELYNLVQGTAWFPTPTSRMMQLVNIIDGYPENLAIGTTAVYLHLAMCSGFVLWLATRGHPSTSLTSAQISTIDELYTSFQSSAWLPTPTQRMADLIKVVQGYNAESIIPGSTPTHLRFAMCYVVFSFLSESREGVVITDEQKRDIETLYASIVAVQFPQATDNMNYLYDKLSRYSLDFSSAPEPYGTHFAMSRSLMHMMRKQHGGPPAGNSKIMWYTWFMLAITIVFILAIGVISWVKSK